MFMYAFIATLVFMCAVMMTRAGFNSYKFQFYSNSCVFTKDQFQFNSIHCTDKKDQFKLISIHFSSFLFNSNSIQIKFANWQHWHLIGNFCVTCDEIKFSHL